MGHLFSKKHVSKVSEQDKSVLQLKTTRDKIRQYQKRSEVTLDKDRLLAKKLLQLGRKERAKLLLRKKHFVEDQLKKTDGQLENIEKLIMDVEFSQIELKVIDSLKIGNESLKQINAMMSIEDVERILEETEEGAEKQNEINALLSGTLTSEDEDAVEDELATLIADAIKQQLPETPAAVDNPELELPSVPDEPLDEKEKSKEPELELPSVPDEPLEEKEKSKEPHKEKVALAAS